MGIKSARKRAGLTQAEVARAVGVSESAVSLWECGHTCPHIRHLRALSELLDVTIDEILVNDKEK